MKFFNDLFPVDSVAHGLATLSLAVTLGLVLGGIRWRGVRLGVSGVLFAAIIFGQIGMTINRSTLDFLSDFALIIFVYAMGLQVGPGFLASFKSEGLRLNLLALTVIGLGALMTAGVVVACHLQHTASSGLFAGAYTNTPALAAGQDVIQRLLGASASGAQRTGSDASSETGMFAAGLAYTVTYPFGTIGPVLVIAWLRKLFRVDIAAERASLAAAEETLRPRAAVADIRIKHPPAAGTRLKDISRLREQGVFFTRLLRDGVVSVPTADTEIRMDDVFHAVGAAGAIAELASTFGEVSEIDLSTLGGDVQRVDLLVTRTEVLRKTLSDLDFTSRFGVTIGRVTRSGVPLLPTAGLKLYFGDRLTVVGAGNGVQLTEAEVGNSPEALNRPQLIPIFLGIVLGVLVGSIPLAFPGLHTSLRIGMAGGPMIVAIALSQLGSIGSLVWYMPTAANQLFRDFGLAVFLACVGLRSGDHFLQNVFQPQGLGLLFFGAIITVLPVFLVAAGARKFLKMNFLTLCGLVSGSMTSMPSLLFAEEIVESDAPAVIYATVAPLAMLAPVVCAQILAVVLI